MPRASTRKTTEPPAAEKRVTRRSARSSRSAAASSHTSTSTSRSRSSQVEEKSGRKKAEKSVSPRRGESGKKKTTKSKSPAKKKTETSKTRGRKSKKEDDKTEVVSSNPEDEEDEDIDKEEKVKKGKASGSRSSGRKDARSKSGKVGGEDKTGKETEEGTPEERQSKTKGSATKEVTSPQKESFCSSTTKESIMEVEATEAEPEKGKKRKRDDDDNGDDEDDDVDTNSSPKKKSKVDEDEIETDGTLDTGTMKIDEKMDVEKDECNTPENGQEEKLHSNNSQADDISQDLAESDSPCVIVLEDEKENGCLEMSDIPTVDTTDSAPPDEANESSNIVVPESSADDSADGGTSVLPDFSDASEATTTKLDMLFSRSFVHSDGTKISGVNSDRSFTLVSYNILADYHAQRDYAVPECWVTSEQLSIEVRHRRLMEELKWLDGDIVCLQEVGTDYFHETLKPALAEIGYDGLYVPRNTTDYGEGEATFFKTAHFTLDSSQSLNLGQLIEKGIDESDLEMELKPSIKLSVETHAVSLLTRLKSVDSDYSVAVANIHVAYDKFQRQDKQCLQIATAVRELINMSGDLNQPHIICGDFNSWPNTPPYQLMRDGHLDEESLITLQAINSIKLPDGQVAPLVNFWSDGFQFPPSSNFKSSYKTILGVEPPSSRFNCDGIIRAVDYIWYSENSLDVLGVLPVVDSCEIQDGVPNDVFPSDHLAIKASFLVK